METEQAILSRVSVRSFTAEKVSEEDKLALMKAAMAAPSAIDRRPWEFYLVTSEEKLRSVRGVMLFGKYESPLIILVCVNELKTLPLRLHDYAYCDLGAASENILLEATARGLGAVWCGTYPEKKRIKDLQKALGLPSYITPYSTIYVGHPSKEAKPKDKFDPKRIHEI